MSSLDRTPKGFTNLFLSIMFGIKPNEESMMHALNSAIETLENLRETFDYTKYREEFPVWASKRL